MTAETKSTVLRALQMLRGDDLYRAEHAWGMLSPADMQKEYGQSGLTRAEILAGYVKHAATVDRAIAEVENL